MTSPTSALALVAALIAAGPAAAQVASLDSRNSPSSLRCSALGQIDEAERPAAIHFMAGYSSGERDATAFATVGPADTLGGDVPEGGTEQAGGSAGEMQAEQSTEEVGGAAEIEQQGATADAEQQGAAADAEQPGAAAGAEQQGAAAGAGQQATTTNAEQQPAAPAADAATPSTGPTGGPPAAVLPTVPVEAVLAACAQSPDSRIIDIIVAQGALGTD